jgi:hypothetical protein
MAWADFIASRRTESTRQTYARAGRLLVKDPDEFLARARDDKRAAEHNGGFELA